MVGVEFAVGLVDELVRTGVVAQVFAQGGLPAFDEAADASADGIVGITLVGFKGEDFAEGVAPDRFVVAAVGVHVQLSESGFPRLMDLQDWVGWIFGDNILKIV